jgi:phosphopantothenoylcysteine decarboxylase / phosphopantothenate---cysteine ligase
MKFIVTAGPTREFLDPFRFISNPSSGKMGFALARAARDRGAEVVLISGPVSLPPVSGVEFIPVVSAREMRSAVRSRLPGAGAVIMAAAVSDYRPARYSRRKLKKGSAGQTLSLVRNPDILEELGKSKGELFLAGFSAETENIIDNAAKKLKSKHLDLIVANDISAPGSGFVSETNRAVVIDRDGSVEEWPLMSKDELAERIVGRILAMKDGRG